MTGREMAVRLEVFPGVESAQERFGNQIEVKCKSESALALLSTMKAIGFEHLSNVAAVDWIDESCFEVIYNLFSYGERLHATVKCRIDRDEPAIATVLGLWPQAQVYEREVHEFFGIHFEGNPDLEPFFLHNWKDLPPLRKDFDAAEYSRRAYGFLNQSGDREEERRA